MVYLWYDVMRTSWRILHSRCSFIYLFIFCGVCFLPYSFPNTNISSSSQGTGRAIMTTKGEDKALVPRLLDLKDRATTLMEKAFFKNPEFQYALKDSFETVVNVLGTKSAELIARYVDLKMRQGKQGSTEQQLESELDKVMALFRYVQSKDVFQAFYKRHLAKVPFSPRFLFFLFWLFPFIPSCYFGPQLFIGLHVFLSSLFRPSCMQTLTHSTHTPMFLMFRQRLLTNKSASSDAEELMIGKIRNECGASFTQKLEGMFKDMRASSTLMEAFSQFVETNNLKPRVDLHVNVLTSGSWPDYPCAPLKIPQEVAETEQLFTDFYMKNNDTRKIQWEHSLATCSIRATYGGRKTHEFVVSAYQATVLLLFRESDGLSFAFIQDATGMERVELLRTLQSLCMPEVRVLYNERKTKKVNDTDVFFVNRKFKHKLRRIKISSIQSKESVCCLFIYVLAFF